MWSRFTVRGVGVLAFAFILTSAAMYWLPFLQRATGWYDTGLGYGYIGSSIDGGYVDTMGDRGGSLNSGSYDISVRNLKKLSPIEERQALDEISTGLKEKTNAELYQMKAFEDVCANSLVECRGLASTKVKPFIDAVLSDRQTTETALYSRAANFISAGSLFVSFIALIFTGLAYRRSRATKRLNKLP